MALLASSGMALMIAYDLTYYSIRFFTWELPRSLLAWRSRDAELLLSASTRLASLKNALGTEENCGLRIAVIIPCLNEAPVIEHAVLSAIRDDGVELVVVDGGSKDGSRAICAELGVRVLDGQVLGCRCRADAMNTGAQATTAPILIFLHADTTLPRGYGQEVRAMLEGGKDKWGIGAFALDFGDAGEEPSSRPWLLRFICWSANMRSRWLRMPYGDQSLFMRREVFEALGRFQSQPLLEDVDFVSLAGRHKGVLSRILRCKMPNNKRCVDADPSIFGSANHHHSNYHCNSNNKQAFFPKLVADGVGSVRPNRLLDLGSDVMDIVATFTHPLDLCRLSLCCKDLVCEVEETAHGLVQRLLSEHMHNPPLRLQSSENRPTRSWRYCYLMAVEVTMVDNEVLRAALAQIYREEPVDKLNLYGLDMGDEGAGHLALALRVSKDRSHVDSINLCRNNISDRGAQVLLDAVCRCHGEVNTLSLAQNRIGALGARCVADLISKSGSLKNLSLSENPITDEGVRLISGALQHSVSLATLSMRSVSVSVNAREDLRGMWGHSSSNRSTLWGLYL